jgi:hypothetical protein
MAPPRKDVPVDLRLEFEGRGRLVATLTDDLGPVKVTAADGRAAALALLEAIDASASDDGYGECFWQEAQGMYWWMFRRLAMRLEIVVLWSSGTVTGWQHVFRAITHAEDFSKAAADLIAQVTVRADQS